MQMGI